MVRKWKLTLMGLSGTVFGATSISCEWVDCLRNFLGGNPT